MEEDSRLRYVLVGALRGLSSCLIEGDIAQQALITFLMHLGWHESDDYVLASLERKLTVPSTLHMFAVADWLLVGDFQRRLSTWLLRLWMQSTHAVLAGIADVDAAVLEAALRAGLFHSASISEQALSAAGVANGLGMLAALLCDGETERKRQRTVKEGETFPIFVRVLSGKSLLIRNCSAETDVLTLKCLVVERTGIPEECIRLVFQGKPLADRQRLQDLGVRRDSTLYLTLAAHTVVNPKAPSQVRVRLYLNGDRPPQPTNNRVVVRDGMIIDDVVRDACHLMQIPCHPGRVVYKGAVLRPDRPVAYYQFPEEAMLHILLQ